MEKLVTLYENVLNAINEGVHVVDAHGKSVIYNQKMTELESMRSEDVLGKHLSDVFHFPNGQASTLLHALQKGKTTRNVKQTYLNAQGKEITTINNTYPIFDGIELLGAIEIANDVTKMERLIRENLLEKKGSTRYTFSSIIGSSDPILEVVENAKRATRTSSSVLLVGETGTGKELFVQSIHNASARASSPFISQNCAALPDSLIEGLLFGTARGAFTGAIERPGLFEEAEGGTLFLDEVNSLTLPLQAKLLRALQEKSIRRIGDTKDRPINVRIIAAINEDPVEAIANNRLRKDLFYRLGVVTLFVPPLRERKADILTLANHFIQKYNELFQMEVLGLHEEVQQFFGTYDWPGNVRELQHVIEGAMNLMDHETEICMSHLPIHHVKRTTFSVQVANEAREALVTEKEVVVPPHTEKSSFASTVDGSPKPLKDLMEAFEAHCIQTCIERNQGNISRASKELGISRQSLQYRLRKLKSKS